MRADLLTLHPESWDPLIRLGMGGHYYGIETFNRKSAKIIGKGMNPEKIKAGLLDAKNYFKSKMFYRATISIIVGLPFESPETFAETENWLDANWQDQALVAFPLDVDDVSQANKKDKYTNVSEFSKNLIKYGIREMPSEKLNRTEDSIRWFYDWRDGGYHSDIFMWEHDDMNIIQAREISERLQFKQLRSYKMNNWVLDYPSISKSKKIPLKETEHLNIMMAGANKATQGRIFVDEYIEKKLNYRP
jgi:radical SAM superfamily enzyme YgiQ (UPF0313 family)